MIYTLHGSPVTIVSVRLEEKEAPDGEKFEAPVMTVQRHSNGSQIHDVETISLKADNGINEIDQAIRSLRGGRLMAKQPFIRGTKFWDAMPRFRLREVKPIEYFFAARFKREHKLWIVWNNTEWSLLEDHRFLSDFTPSNEEARKLLMSYSMHIDQIRRIVAGDKNSTQKGMI